jgi:hypothetical protein
MKKFSLPLGFFVMLTLACNARADVILGTSNPYGSPLTITAGDNPSASMLINVHSNGSDIMASWGVDLIISGDAAKGFSGAVSFADPTPFPNMPTNPPNYIFAANGSSQGGIFVLSLNPLIATDSDGSLLNPTGPYGVSVPSSPANLLQVDFAASANASGFFDVFADISTPNSNAWQSGGSTVGSLNNFTYSGPSNSPTLIGEIEVTPSNGSATPEPASVMLLLLGVVGLGAYAWRRRRPVANGTAA